MLSTLSKQTLKAIGIAAVAIVTGTVFGSHRPAVGDPVGPQVPIVLGFDEVTGMTSISRNPIPDSAKISTNYLSRYGVVFRSTAGYVAVVKLPRRDSISPPNGIGGSSAEGKLSYDSKNPISIGFFDKAATGAPAVTDFVSVRCDQDGSGIDVHLVAYDVNGAEIAEDAKKDSDGATLSVHAVGIHSVTFFGTSDDDGAALDDVTFDPAVTVIPPQLPKS